MAKKLTSKEKLELLQKYLPDLMGTEDFTRDQVADKLDKLQKDPEIWKNHPTDWNDKPVFPLYEALADPEAAHSYFAPYKYSPEVNESINKFSTEVGQKYPSGKASRTDSTKTTPPPPAPPAGDKLPTEGAPDAKSAVAKKGGAAATPDNSVSARIKRYEEKRYQVLDSGAAAPAGFEFVSVVGNKKVYAPLAKDAVGQAIPEPSQESLRKSVATRTGPDYASESTSDLMGRARQARAVVNGMSDTGAMGQQATARSEYNTIRKTLADRKMATDANAATAAVQASADRVKAYGEAYDKYQAGISGEGDDKAFGGVKQNKDSIWKSMDLSEKTQATNGVIAKSRALDQAPKATPTPKPTPAPLPKRTPTLPPPPIEEEKKKNELLLARNIFRK